MENLWIILTCFIFIRLGYDVIICRTWYFNARSLAIIYVMFLAQEVDGHFMLCSMQQDFIYWKHIRKYNKTFNTENTTYNTARLALKINQTYHRCSCTKKITENKIKHLLFCFNTRILVKVYGVFSMQKSYESFYCVYAINFVKVSAVFFNTKGLVKGSAVFLFEEIWYYFCYIFNAKCLLILSDDVFWCSCNTRSIAMCIVILQCHNKVEESGGANVTIWLVVL